MRRFQIAEQLGTNPPELLRGLEEAHLLTVKNNADFIKQARAKGARIKNIDADRLGATDDIIERVNGLYVRKDKPMIFARVWSGMDDVVQHELGHHVTRLLDKTDEGVKLRRTLDQMFDSRELHDLMSAEYFKTHVPEFMAETFARGLWPAKLLEDFIESLKNIGPQAKVDDAGPIVIVEGESGAIHLFEDGRTEVLT